MALIYWERGGGGGGGPPPPPPAPSEYNQDMTTGYNAPARVGEAVLETKGSRFYARAVPTATEGEVQALLAAARAGRPEANHHAYAYRLGPAGEIARFSDDGEPGGTAGRPMMEALLREGLVDIAVVVSRRFGGTLLGAGGLARAYGGAAAEAVRAAGVVTLRPHARLRLTVEYGLLGAVEQEVHRLGLRAPKIEYGERATLTLLAPAGEVALFQERVRDLSAGRVEARVEGTAFAE